MTNLPAIVAITLLTNLTENVHPDGSRMTIVETVTKCCFHQWDEGGVAHCHTNLTTVGESIKRYRRTWQLIETTPPVPPPMPQSLSTPKARNPFLIPEPPAIGTNEIESLRAKYRSKDGTVTNIYIGPMPSSRVSFFLASGEPMMLTGTFSDPMPPPDDVEMFTVEFPTETNRIYRFEGTKDLVTWQYLPPELDGTGQPDTFYDKHEGISAYRVVSREGVLPVED